MAKTATEYFKVHPFKVTERGFDPAHNRVAESVFSLGNEYMGVRGFAEEGITCDTLVGCYFNGIYEYALEDTPIHYKGIVQRTHFMVNSVNWLDTGLELGGERLDTASCRISNYLRELDMRRGTLTRSFVWHTQTGKSLRVEFMRFLSMTQCERGYQTIRLTPLNFSGTLRLRLGLEGNVLHFGSHCYWEHALSRASEGGAALLSRTPTTGQQVLSAFAFTCNGEYTAIPYEGSLRAGVTLELSLKEGEEVLAEKYVVNLAEKRLETAPEALAERGLAMAAGQREAGIAAALAEACAYWDGVWEESDIEICGDERNQQGIRFCIFQLAQTYHGADPSNNIGAKGLTGEAYSGHAFWDTETYCLPYYLFHSPEAAKNLLLYRYRTLDAARERARELDCEGACYPIATLNGREACNLWQHASLQFQPSTGVAYGIWHYVRVTGDEHFLQAYGFEMLAEVSKFLLSRGQWSADGERFGYYCVMGPDEFQMMVNHNCYTNYMARRTMEYCLECAARYPSLARKFGLNAEVRREMEHACARMYLPRNGATGVYEQHEGFFRLPHVDVDAILPEEFPLYSHWSYDRIYRNDMIKQPDVLMFLFLYNRGFTWEEKLANYEYYEPRTIHESSLSPSVHSVFASELGKEGEALNFFGFATRMDLDDYNRNTSEGLHTTSIAAAWMNIVYGFGGLRSDGERLSLSPSIPEIWQGYSFRLQYRGCRVKVEVERERFTVSAKGGDGLEIEIYGRPCRIPAGAEVSLPIRRARA